MKLGILGGSFNPVHNGHLYLAEKAISELELDRVVFVPAYRSPFKLDASGMEHTTEERINMLAVSVAGDPRFAIDDCEIKREGVSYTVHTLEDIITRYMPNGKPYLLIGDDLAVDFPKWRDSERILEMAEIVVARRLNSDAKEYPYPHKLIKNKIMDISSQTVRKMITEQDDWKPLVPSAAVNIIMEKRLYGVTDSGEENPPSEQDSIVLRVEQAVRAALNTSRFLHSRNTALFAYDMCRRFRNECSGIDPMDAYLAGIAHDLAKQLDPKEMIKLVKNEGKSMTAVEKGKPSLLHGRAAAVLLRDRFSIHNKDILEAVALHTSGSENMGTLAKIIYIADKLEVSRSSVNGLRKMCREAELDDILYAVLKKTVSKLQSRELDLSEETLKLLAKMEGKNN
ncbi:MAG: nicotinate (nicotinamide) nucleotide adenylyltransferase [Treponema sp.]|jgi:nicotinate-nucleotide adenylyltransferase|nr:nicotinate (nicotinamide) nucleotide adenylyltransferase [Treponema sp.]